MIDQPRVLLLDTETTGIENPEVIQFAYFDLGIAQTIPASLGVSEAFQVEAEFMSMYKPEGEIRPSAMAAHHIIPEDLVDAPPSNSLTLPYSSGYMVGHNVEFDWGALGSPVGFKLICTLAMARRVWPEFERHTQTALMYELFPAAEAREAVKSAHDALADIVICHKILIMLEHAIRENGIDEEFNNVPVFEWNWERWWEFSEWCRVPTHMLVGKHKGEPIGEVPTSYLQWMMRQDFDHYTLKAVRAELTRRG